MSGYLIFEQSYRGHMWQLRAVEHDGRVHCDFRRWYWEAGLLKPSRDGLVFPMARLPELYAAMGDYLAGEAPVGL